MLFFLNPEAKASRLKALPRAHQRQLVTIEILNPGLERT